MEVLSTSNFSSSAELHQCLLLTSFHFEVLNSIFRSERKSEYEGKAETWVPVPAPMNV